MPAQSRMERTPRAGLSGPITTASLASMAALTSSVIVGGSGAVRMSSRTSVSAGAAIQYSRSGRRSVPVSTSTRASASVIGRMVAPMLCARHCICTTSVRVAPSRRRFILAIWTARARSPIGRGSDPATFGRWLWVA